MTEENTLPDEPTAAPPAIVDVSDNQLPEPMASGAPQVAPPPATPATLIPVLTTAANEAVNVDDNALRQLIDQLRPVFIAGVSDALSVAKEAVTQAADYYVPLIAQTSLLASNPDPAVRMGADRQMRHLRGQALMNAATLGIPLQQRTEQRFLSVIETLVSAGVSILGGGLPAAAPLIEKLGAAAVAALQK